MAADLPRAVRTGASGQRKLSKGLHDSSYFDGSGGAESDLASDGRDFRDPFCLLGHLDQGEDEDSGFPACAGEGCAGDGKYDVLSDPETEGDLEMRRNSAAHWQGKAR